ncbi:F-box/kelch-repeat protein At3g06240-like isoform X1 [Papaver somniferum]|uniref:F-box/kelch-repeat protein At3g06240-like isoform X1 n=1 Tax=Papaver somniferum TaxID=3469 RepID=UPI000E6F68EC|nr:F-box/kelch-repeat protein At3g06240-like isoform X1 [Papaver somniferum]
MSSIPIPEEILHEVLLRVPLVSISKFRCVCKQWNSLLSNPSFVKSHFDLAIQNEKPNFILVIDVENGYKIIRVNQDSLLSCKPDSECGCEPDSECGCERCDESSYLRYPFEQLESREINILGVCNGLLCLLISVMLEEGIQDIICIWNPKTKEYKELPYPPSEFSCGVKIIENCSDDGFYYDSSVDDYKLIKIVPISGELMLGVQIYSLRSNSWKNSEKFIPYESSSLHRSSGVLVNGALHWLLITPGNRTSNVIVSFNTCDEGFADLDATNELGRLDECLCLLVGSLGDRADLWVMQKYGVKQSWTKLLTTTKELIADNNFMSNSMPICTYKSGEILMPNLEGFVVYDPKCDKAKLITIRAICGASEVSEIESYIESLVSLGSFTYVGKHDIIEDISQES